MATDRTSIKKYLQQETGIQFSPSFVVDGDKLGQMSDSELFQIYRSCKAARAARIIIFYELQRRARQVAKLRCVDFFQQHDLNYDTEYKFVPHEEERLLEELHPTIDLPKPEELKPLAAGETVFEKTNLENRWS